MKKLFIVGALLGLFGTSHVFASDVENVNVVVEQTGLVTAKDHVDYWITNQYIESGYGKRYLCFTVNWKYTGDRERPYIAFQVTISNGVSFLDSAIGIGEGSRDYKIEIDQYSTSSYNISVVGSDGSPA